MNKKVLYHLTVHSMHLPLGLPSHVSSFLKTIQKTVTRKFSEWKIILILHAICFKMMPIHNDSTFDRPSAKVRVWHSMEVKGQLFVSSGFCEFSMLISSSKLSWSKLYLFLLAYKPLNTASDCVTVVQECKHTLQQMVLKSAIWHSSFVVWQSHRSDFRDVHL